MRFTVITPCLNRENFIAEAIESVLAQKYDDVEHWIIDGGSKDKTLDIVRGYPHLRVLSEQDRGVYDAFNKGLERATGDAVIFLNSDDLLTPGTLALARKIFENALGTQIISGGCEIFRQTDAGREIKMHCYDNPKQNQLSFRNVTLGFPNINARIFRRSVFDKVGRFDLAYTIASDRDLLMRAALANTTQNFRTMAPRMRIYGRDDSGSETQVGLCSRNFFAGVSTGSAFAVYSVSFGAARDRSPHPHLLSSLPSGVWTVEFAFFI
jgi:glycosyltransferase involved in cell wall biosynthesis